MHVPEPVPKEHNGIRAAMPGQVIQVRRWQVEACDLREAACKIPWFSWSQEGASAAACSNGDEEPW